jgi:orotate phosphoribosyltransferase
MYHLVTVDHNSWQHISPEEILDRNNDVICGMAVKGVRKMKALSVNMDAVTMISKGR